MASAARTAPSNSVALWILATVASVWFLRTASQLLIPIVLAILISYALEPVVAWLGRHRLSRIVGTSLVMLTILALLAWGMYSLRDDAIEAVEALPKAAQRAREMLMSGSGGGAIASVQRARDEVRGSSSAAEGANQSQKQAGGSQPEPQTGSQDAPSGGQGQQVPSGGASILQRGLSSIAALAGNLVVIFFLVFFLLLSGPHFRRRLVEVAGPDPERRKVTATIIDDINEQIERFLLVRLLTAIVVAALTWAVLALMSVPNAAIWGILAGVFNSIPYFGPIIVSGGLFVVGLVQGGGMAQALRMSGAALVITSLEGWLLTPPLMGKAERMNVLVVFLGVLLWSWIWGPWGTLLAVPMLVVIKSVADRVEPLKPVGRLMAP